MTKSRFFGFSLIEIVFFIAFFVFIILANSYDWDYVYSFGEVDRRSWLIDHAAPLWTYQLCGGVTRLGDPNSFGLSPLFGPVLAFGSYWGSKILVMILMLLGFFSIKQILNWITVDRSDEADSINSCLTLSFMTSNFFLWHVGEGHVTFPIIYLALTLVYLFLPATEVSLTWAYSLIIVIFSFAFFTGPFYHTFIFFLLPVGLGACLWLLLARPKAVHWKGVFQWILAAGIGLLLSSFRIQGLLAYQAAHPRTLVNRVPEVPSLLKLAVDFFLPTWNGLFIGMYSSLQGGIQEYSTFSPLSWLFVLLLIGIAWNYRKRLKLPKLQSQSLFIITGVLVCFLFCLGDRYSWLPFPLMNSLLLKNSAREVGRFQGALLFEILLAVSLILRNNNQAREKFLRYGIPLVSGLSLLNFLTFSNILSLETFLKITHLPKNETSAMNSLTLVAAPDFTTSYMYPDTLSAKVILNCYEPLLRQMNVANTDGALKPLKFVPGSTTIELLENEKINGDGLNPCLKNSWVTQNELHVDLKNCPVGTCLNLNGINPSDASLPIRFNLESRKFCLTN